MTTQAQAELLSDLAAAIKESPAIDDVAARLAAQGWVKTLPVVSRVVQERDAAHAEILRLRHVLEEVVADVQSAVENAVRHTIAQALTEQPPPDPYSYAWPVATAP
jgi:hypothetical protein